MGCAGDRSVPVRTEDDYGDRAGVDRSDPDRWNRCAGAAFEGGERSDRWSRRNGGEPSGILAGFLPWLHERSSLDDSADLLCLISRCSMVELVVSGGGAGRRRVRSAANVQRQGREEFP